LPNTKAASSPVVGRPVDSGREIHKGIVGGRKLHLHDKLKHPEKFLP
jgi:hypothetical protein